MKKALPTILFIIVLIALVCSAFSIEDFTLKGYLQRFDNLPKRPTMPDYKDYDKNAEGFFDKVGNFFKFTWSFIEYIFDYIGYIFKSANALLGGII